jgi:hypothetical protein
VLQLPEAQRATGQSLVGHRLLQRIRPRTLPVLVVLPAWCVSVSALLGV